jgi:hypothetical protein
MQVSQKLMLKPTRFIIMIEKMGSKTDNSTVDQFCMSPGNFYVFVERRWNLFYPKNIDVLTYQPNVLITGIQLYGKDIDQSGGLSENLFLLTIKILMRK